jgi:PhnB protein
MSAPTPYIHFPGTARHALTSYGDIFGCAVQLHTFEEFGRADGPPAAIAHGRLLKGPVSLYAADAGDGEPSLHTEGLMLSLLGSAPPPALHDWFTRLSADGEVMDDLQRRPWGATDGQVVDRYGIHWLIGYEPEIT